MIGNRLSEAAVPYGTYDAEFTLWGDDADGDKHCPDEVRYLSALDTLITADGDL